MCLYYFSYMSQLNRGLLLEMGSLIQQSSMVHMLTMLLIWEYLSNLSMTVSTRCFRSVKQQLSFAVILHHLCLSIILHYFVLHVIELFGFFPVKLSTRHGRGSLLLLLPLLVNKLAVLWQSSLCTLGLWQMFIHLHKLQNISKDPYFWYII